MINCGRRGAVGKEGDSLSQGRSATINSRHYSHHYWLTADAAAAAPQPRVISAQRQHWSQYEAPPLQTGEG
jgi:hypothetical protein